MNLARARRRWRAWDRYVDYCIRLSPDTRATRGMNKAYNERAKWRSWRNYRAMLTEVK